MSQPDPIENEETPIYKLVLEDLTARAELGKEQYGTYLQPHNGRNALIDAYEEALDFTLYLRQALEESPEPRINWAEIIYFGESVAVLCDRNCKKAWGWNDRPKLSLSSDPEDVEWFSDRELGFAPVDPGTIEGDSRKPSHPDQFPTKWCVRQCERCVMIRADSAGKLPGFKDWGKRLRNIEND